MLSESFRDGSRISGKGVHMYKGGGRFADFISFFLLAYKNKIM